MGQDTAADTRPDSYFKSRFFFEFPLKAGLRGFVAFRFAAGQFPFLSFISQQKDL
jgi:hypothetical protein